MISRDSISVDRMVSAQSPPLLLHLSHPHSFVFLLMLLLGALLGQTQRVLVIVCLSLSLSKTHDPRHTLPLFLLPIVCPSAVSPYVNQSKWSSLYKHNKVYAKWKNSSLLYNIPPIITYNNPYFVCPENLHLTLTYEVTFIQIINQ